jgi:hypothetical protein
VEKAINSLRDNGLIVSGRLDETTGEIVPLSASAIIRALRQYRLHPDQLRAPAPAVQLASRHPNHVWQLDASICVLYYLKNPAKGVKGDTGLRIMDEKSSTRTNPPTWPKSSMTASGLLKEPTTPPGGSTWSTASAAKPPRTSPRCSSI